MGELESAWPEKIGTSGILNIYADKNFIGPINGRTSLRKQPRLLHTLWNKHDAVIKDELLRTNFAEGLA